MICWARRLSTRREIVYPSRVKRSVVYIACPPIFHPVFIKVQARYAAEPIPQAHQQVDLRESLGGSKKNPTISTLSGVISDSAAIIVPTMLDNRIPIRIMPAL